MTAAVVLYAGARTSHGALPELLTGIAAAARAADLTVTAHVLHGGLEPAIIDAATAADPFVRFLRADVEHYAQFEVDETQRQRLRATDAIGLAGFTRVLVAPAAPGVVELLVPGLTSRLGSVPDDGWTTDLGSTDNRILLLDGARCGSNALARFDLALAERQHERQSDGEPITAPWALLRDLGAVARPAPVTDAPAADVEPAPDVEAALRESRSAYTDADFARSRAIVAAAYPTAGERSAEVLLQLARSLAATSEDAAARAVLGLVRDRHADDHAAISSAETQLAELAWVRHDLPAGERHALAALRTNPANRRATVLRDRCRQQPATPSPDALAHVAFYPDPGGNVGDAVLTGAVRSAVAEATGTQPDWVGVHAHQVFERDRLGDVRGVIVGGGGLLLPDSAPNGRSGWQWNVASETLDDLDVPLAVVAIGHNLFPGQQFGPQFAAGLTALVERASLVGLQNHGSVRQVQQLLPDRLAEKITWLPCPTTVLADLRSVPDVSPEPALVLVNAAYDRSARRFGTGYDTFLAGLADWVRALQRDGVEVRCAAHLPADEQLAEDLQRVHGLRIGIDALHALDVEDVLRRYARATLVVGMRGHATMIPFGLGTPVLSLISHPELRYFLEDVDRPDWGIDVAVANLAPTLLERTRDVLARPQAYRDDIVELRKPLLAAVRTPLVRFAAETGLVTASA